MLTAVVLTHNSASQLSNCLTSLKFCDAITIVDDNSTDDTLKIAKKYHAAILNHSLSGDFSAQRNFALSQIKSHWVLFVDSDEEITRALGDEILLAIQKIEFKGFLIKRTDYLWDKKITHGDVGNHYLLRLGRNGAGEWQGQVHERWRIPGRIGKLKGEIVHHPHPSIVDFVNQVNQYSTIRASELYSQKFTSNLIGILFFPIGKFVNLYFLKLGFLDGTAGFIHAMAMAFYSFLVRGKLYLLGKGIPETS